MLAYFQRNGYRVSIPFGDNSPYDALVESPTGKIYRIQTRLCRWDNEVLSLRLRSISKNYNKRIDMSRIDAFAAWDGERIYIVPVEQIANRKAVFGMRRNPSKNNQRAKVNLASDHLDATWHLP